MRDDDEYEDDDEEPEAEERPRFPGIVMAAGVIWIAVGSLAFINGILSVVMAGANAANGGGGANAGSPCCGIIIAIAFISCGYQTVTGKAKDTLGNSIGSMVMGLIYLAVGIGFALIGAGVFGNVNALPIAPEAIIVVAILTGLMGTAHEAAGVFALIGRRAYREWREVAHPKKRRRIRRRDDDEDEDDA